MITAREILSIARALKAAKPKDFLTNTTARTIWFNCITEVAQVLPLDSAVIKVTAERFFDECEVPT